jgi:hypothetical protein
MMTMSIILTMMSPRLIVQRGRDYVCGHAHEKRGKKARTEEKGQDAALWLMVEVGEVSGGGRDNSACSSPKDKNSAQVSSL